MDLWEGHWEGREWLVGHYGTQAFEIPVRPGIDLTPYFAAALASTPGFRWHKPYNQISFRRSSLDPNWNAFHFAYKSFEAAQSDWDQVVLYGARLKGMS